MVPTPIILALITPMYPMPTYYTDSTCDFMGVQHEQLQKLCAQKIPDLMFFYHLEILKLFNKIPHFQFAHGPENYAADPVWVWGKCKVVLPPSPA